MRWIAKSSNAGVACCSCTDTAPAQLPGAAQLDCPWCGCGWLFMCLNCGLAFTYGQAIDIDTTPRDIARKMEREIFGAESVRRTRLVDSWVRAIERTSKLISKASAELCVLDGVVLPIDYRVPAPGVLVGTYGLHTFEQLPQAMTRDSDELVRILGKDYWLALERKSPS